jgi:acyl-CoA synthetase (AMP-forming)/AMP-acid ligase II
MPLNHEQGTLLVTAIEEKARRLANHTVFRYPTVQWETDGYRNLTWSQWSNAINKVAFWLDEHLNNADSKTVAYLGPDDIRYAILMPAMIKTGRRVSGSRESRRTPD